jgi:molecular chaperone Hsp33
VDDAAILARGRLQTGLAGGGSLRWAVANLSEVVETARERLDLSPVAAAALGRTMTSAALLLRLAAKTPARLLVDIRGDGPLGQVLAEADDTGNLRGLVANPRLDLPPRPDSKLPVGVAVGRGFLRVLRELPRGTYQSQVELVSGEIGEDVAHFLAQSEQTRTAVLVGVLTRPTGVAAAGGLIVELIPGAREDALRTLEANIAGVAGVSWLVEEGGLEGVLATVLADLDPEVKEERPLYYRCRCSRARLHRHLALLPQEDLAEYRLPDGTIEAECQFCAAQYRFSPEELSLPVV